MPALFSRTLALAWMEVMSCARVTDSDDFAVRSSAVPTTDAAIRTATSGHLHVRDFIAGNSTVGRRTKTALLLPGLARACNYARLRSSTRRIPKRALEQTKLACLGNTKEQYFESVHAAFG